MSCFLPTPPMPFLTPSSDDAALTSFIGHYSGARTGYITNTPQSFADQQMPHYVPIVQPQQQQHQQQFYAYMNATAQLQYQQQQPQATLYPPSGYFKPEFVDQQPQQQQQLLYYQQQQLQQQQQQQFPNTPTTPTATVDINQYTLAQPFITTQAPSSSIPAIPQRISSRDDDMSISSTFPLMQQSTDSGASLQQLVTAPQPSGEDLYIQQQPQQQFPGSFLRPPPRPQTMTAPLTASPFPAPPAPATPSNYIMVPPASHPSQYLELLPYLEQIPIYDKRFNKVSIGLSGVLSGNFFISRAKASNTGAIRRDSLAESEDSPSSHNDKPEQEDEKEKAKSPKLSDNTSSPKLEPRTHNRASSITSSDAGHVDEELPYDLTFYRRNLFQISCTLKNAREAYYAAYHTNAGNKSDIKYSRILSLKLGISVSGTDETKPIKLLYSPPKTAQVSSGPHGADGMMDESFFRNTSKEGIEPNLKRVYTNDSGYDDVIDWKRLQFSSATAHNGRKRLQNFFTITVTLYAELENTQRVALVKASSRPIVVRGRNPRFYQFRENIPLSDSHSLLNRNRIALPASQGASQASEGSVSQATATSSTVSHPPEVPETSPKRLRLSKDTQPGGVNGNKPKEIKQESIKNEGFIKATQQPHVCQKHLKKKKRRTTKTSLTVYDTDADNDVSMTDKDGEDDGIPCSCSTSDQEATQILNSPPGYIHDDDSITSEEEVSDLEDDATNHDPNLLDPDDVVLDEYQTYEYIAIDHNYWSPPVEVVYRPHAAKHMFPTQQQVEQQMEAQHRQLVGFKRGAGGGTVPLVAPPSPQKRKYATS